MECEWIGVCCFIKCVLHPRVNTSNHPKWTQWIHTLNRVGSMEEPQEETRPTGSLWVSVSVLMDNQLPDKMVMTHQPPVNSMPLHKTICHQTPSRWTVQKIRMGMVVTRTWSQEVGVLQQWDQLALLTLWLLVGIRLTRVHHLETEPQLHMPRVGTPVVWHQCHNNSTNSHSNNNSLTARWTNLLQTQHSTLGWP